MQSLNSLNDQIASFMVTGPKPLEPEEHAFCPPEKETLQKSMTLMRHLLVDAQVQETITDTIDVVVQSRLKSLHFSSMGVVFGMLICYMLWAYLLKLFIDHL